MGFRGQSSNLRVLVLSLAAIVMASSAAAGTIFVGDLTEAAPSVGASGGAGVSGVTCSVDTSVETCSFTIVAPGTAAGFSLDFSAVNMFEPGSPVVSDLLVQTDFSGSNTIWTFTSDVEGGTVLTALPTTASTNNLDENGLAQIVATVTYFNGAGAPIGTDVLQIQSDVADVAPEPSTGALALLGFAALGVVMLRRRTASRAA